MDNNKSNNKRIGQIGENVAALFLVKQGHTLLSKNFRTKYSEIDLISIDNAGILHFTEVKTVSQVTFVTKFSRETPVFMPYKKVNYKKIRKIWLSAEEFISVEKPNFIDIQINACSVFVGFKKKVKIVCFIENINCWVKDMVTERF
jgi:Holliday junction resolvase-like predicted endonuclease